MRKYPRSEVPRLLNVHQGIFIGASSRVPNLLILLPREGAPVSTCKASPAGGLGESVADATQSAKQESPRAAISQAQCDAG